MILEFSITNFFSFKNKVTFSMLASNTGGLKNNYTTINNRNILNTAAIYGANASGKTNIFKVLTNIILMIRKSNELPLNANLPIIPFKFDKKTITEPSKFEIKFITNNNRYCYGFVANSKRIIEEYLYYYPNGRESLIFDRGKESNDYPREDRKKLEEISSKTPNNRLFLSSSAYWGYEKTKDAFNFFENIINTYSNIEDMQSYSFKKYYDYQKNDNESLKKFALKILKDADMNIIDYNIIQADIPREILTLIPEPFKAGIEINPKGYGVSFTHKNSSVDMDYNEESKGTQILFNFIPFLMEATQTGSVLVIDELDRSLHPELLKMIINIFHNKKTNTGNAQLIFSTHDTHLMDITILRKDQIWFTDKDSDTGISDLYTLADFKKVGDNFEKGYLMGKYDAVPKINNIINLNYKTDE